MKLKLLDLVNEVVSIQNMGSPPDSGPNTFVTFRKWKQLHKSLENLEKFYKIKSLIVDKLATNERDLMDIKSGDSVGNLKNAEAGWKKYDKFNKEIAKLINYMYTDIWEKYNLK